MNEVRNAFRWLMAATVFLFVCGLLVAAIGFYYLHREVVQNAKSRTVQCVQFNRLGVRIDRTQRILDHTKGMKLVFAIPRALIVQGQRDDKADRRALAILDCPKKEKQ